MNIKTIGATAALTAFLLPSLAFAHGAEGKANVQANVSAKIEKALDRVERKDDHRKDKEERRLRQATATAAAITKAAVQVQSSADALLSFNTRVSALIASASAAERAALQTEFAAYTTAAANAKVEAGKAIAAVAGVTAQTGSTTNATLLAQAKTDLKEARGLLHDALQGFFSVIRSLWNS